MSYLTVAALLEGLYAAKAFHVFATMPDEVCDQRARMAYEKTEHFFFEE
jgi:hypothetical protein